MSFDVSAIFQVAGIGLIMAMIHTILRQAGKEEYAFWAGIIGFVVVLLMVAKMISDLFQEIQRVFLFH